MEKALIVARREYSKMVKSKAFWLTTLMIPLLITIIGLISGVSQNSLEEKLASEANNAKGVYVMDETGLINKDLLAQTPNFTYTDNFAEGELAVREGLADVFIHYPADLTENKSVNVLSQDKGILTMGLYDELARNLMRQNILAEIPDPSKQLILNSTLSVNTRLFSSGEEIDAGFGRFVPPIASLVIYFLFTSVASSYLLLSVSEEKENRMIEIVLSVIKPRDLILGKVFGQIGAILTQIFVLVAFGLIALQVSGFTLPPEFAQIEINPGQLILALVYLIAGFLILAFTMVGVGAAMPTYKEANGFASVFIMLSIFPIYFFTLILAEPTGTLAVALSYFPYTAPMILMLRNALGVLSVAEIILSLVALGLSIVFIAWVSYKMFEFGAMEYNQKVSFRDFFRTKFRKATI